MQFIYLFVYFYSSSNLASVCNIQILIIFTEQNKCPVIGDKIWGDRFDSLVNVTYSSPANLIY